MSEKKEDPEYLAKRALLEAAGLDPDSELAKQPLHVVIREIQSIMRGGKKPDSTMTQATSPKESPAPTKDKTSAETPAAKASLLTESKEVGKPEKQIQDQYQASLAEILGLWEKSIKYQKSNLDQVCGFLNVKKYGLGEELHSYVDWAVKATNEGLSETEFNKEMKKRAESLQKLLDTSLPAGEKLAQSADDLRKQIQRNCTLEKEHHLRIDEFTKEMVRLFEKYEGEV